MGKVLVVMSFSLLFGQLSAETLSADNKIGESGGSMALRGHRGLQSETCPGGIAGIPSKDGTVCCDDSCGQCGGTGCSTFPGGQGNCCIDGDNGILANSDYCSPTTAAPCKIDHRGTCPGGVVGIPSSDGTVCCDDSCGQCGGTGCATFPGGQGNCCIDGDNGILVNSDFCSRTMAAPCVLNEGGTCPGGIAGIPSNDGTACCNDSCGQCGGTGCSTFPGGQGNCCLGGENGILANSDSCSRTMAAPCKFDDAPAQGCKVVIIEGEDLAVRGAWNIESDTRASGGKYIVWEGLSPEENNRDWRDGDVISTTIDIPIAGTYSFKWLMRQPFGVEIDKGNDTWLYFPDATRFGPAGSNAEYGTFVKVFGNAAGLNFRYRGRAQEENDDTTEIAVEFARAGPYTMQIAGRSHGHEIDHIILFGDTLDVDDAAESCE